jgi:hypothetical protein
MELVKDTTKDDLRRMCKSMDDPRRVRNTPLKLQRTNGLTNKGI